MDPSNLEANAVHGEDDLGLLRSFPAESVDLIYLDPSFFSSWIHEASWADRADKRSPGDRRQGGMHAYLDWIEDPLENLHRILKPTGAIFLVCDEAIGLYVRLLLDELFSQQDARSQTVWWKADAKPTHHHVFYYRKSADTTGRNGHLYTVIHPEKKDDWSLVAFSFVQGRRGRRVANLHLSE